MIIVHVTCIASVVVRSLGTPHCSSEADYCQANAKCLSYGNVFVCSCKEGFIGNGVLCVGNEKIITVLIVCPQTLFFLRKSAERAPEHGARERSR